ncbi:hypothetical protein TSUD_122620 [Trifolium subterraneum]|nr:hypothetical protein TSUD_122620 [Trifolium subterraneum]
MIVVIRDGYNDFNTFYMQAASGTKEGSSGSPVIDWRGRAVALNAWGNTSNTLAFFLPLERVIFLHKGFYETRPLGLISETEQTVRQDSPASETGMLVVESVVPGGPADKHLEPGDVLVRVNDQVIIQFLKLETKLDDNVNSNIELQIERGGSSKTLTILVEDLHSITPDYFLEVSGAVIHPLPYQQKSVVTNSGNPLTIASSGYPFYRATNMEVIELDSDNGNSFLGVLTDEQGRVQALWGVFSTQVQMKLGGNTSGLLQFSKGIPIYAISQVLDKIISGANGPLLLINDVKRSMPQVRTLEVELKPKLLSKARSLGLSDLRIKTLVNKDPIRQHVLQVEGCWAGSKAENLLAQGDIILAINKEPVRCFRDIENACQALDKSNTNDGKLQMTILRQGQEIELLVGTDVRDGNGTTRAVSWCACIVQDPHSAVRALGFLPEKGRGVYVARCFYGSPGQRYGLCSIKCVVEINGKPTPDLDSFVDVTKEQEHGEFFRVRTVQLNGNPQIVTLKQDLHYWPTWELRFNPDTAIWHRNVIKALNHSTV